MLPNVELGTEQPLQLGTPPPFPLGATKLVGDGCAMGSDSEALQPIFDRSKPHTTAFRIAFGRPGSIGRKIENSNGKSDSTGSKPTILTLRDGNGLNSGEDCEENDSLGE
jgi:hypothetical protein